MIAGATKGRGGSALAHHLADSKQHNEVTLPGLYRGLVSTGIRNQVKELTGIVSHARSNSPLLHVHANPDTGREWTDVEWLDWWQSYEDEFGLQNQAFHESIHVKNGRTHKHRTYSLVKPDGICIKLPHQQRRHEKLSRLAEIRTGASITKGAHNHAVLNALEKAGRHQEVIVLKEAGIHLGERARAGRTPKERAQEERSGVSKENINKIVFQCWMETRNQTSENFQDSLNAWGLSLCQGDKVPVVVDDTGNCHPLLRAINAGSKEAKNLLKLKKKELDNFLSDLTLPSFRKIKTELKEERNNIQDIIKHEDHKFNLGDENDTRKQIKTNIRNAEISQRFDKFKSEDIQQHDRHIGFDTETRRWSARPNSRDKRPSNGTDIKPERDQRHVAKNLAKARLRVGLQDSHLHGILVEYQMDKPKFKIRKFDAYLVACIKNEIEKNEPDIEFLQKSYICMSVYYVQKYPKNPWINDRKKEDEALKSLLELALSVLNLISEFFFGVSFVEASHEFQDDLAYDVKANDDYKNELDYMQKMTIP